MSKQAVLILFSSSSFDYELGTSLAVYVPFHVTTRAPRILDQVMFAVVLSVSNESS